MSDEAKNEALGAAPASTFTPLNEDALRAMRGHPNPHAEPKAEVAPLVRPGQKVLVAQG